MDNSVHTFFYFFVKCSYVFSTVYGTKAFKIQNNRQNGWHNLLTVFTVKTVGFLSSKHINYYVT